MANAHNQNLNMSHSRSMGSSRTKGQMSMMVFALGVVFFIMLGIFLFTSNIKSKDTDYVNMYVHNLLLSTMRTSTGYGHPCISVSDTISCAYLTPNRLCGTEKCSDIVQRVTESIIERAIKPNYGYFIIVEPENWDIVGGERITMGDPDTESKRPHYVANEKILAYGSNLRIELIITTG
ncbi:MAG: hypothetical protein JW716_03400 [Candidatus Aenigmarchaeota archaeon]|nr:hypothetical protein [Candidatus Aenigmarchaeota archaeon]